MTGKPRRILVKSFSPDADKRSVYIVRQYAEYGIDGEELNIIGQSEFETLSDDEKAKHRLCDYYRIMRWDADIGDWEFDDYFVDEEKIELVDITKPKTISKAALQELIAQQGRTATAGTGAPT